jgi:hypothetical protein
VFRNIGSNIKQKYFDKKPVKGTPVAKKRPPMDIQQETASPRAGQRTGQPRNGNDTGT